MLTNRLRLAAIAVIAVLALFSLYNSSLVLSVYWEKSGCDNNNNSKEESSSSAAGLLSSSPRTRAPPTHTPYYRPAEVEDYLMKNADQLGYNNVSGSSNQTGGRIVHHTASGCEVWRNATVAPLIHNKLHAFRQELAEYNKRMDSFRLRDNITDIRHHLVDDDDDNNDICNALELHPDGLAAIFPSGQLSRTPLSGWVEPLLPPMRHPGFCFRQKGSLMSLRYLIHDFAAMCRNKLTRTSRTVLVDMGASLSFHGQNVGSPAVYLTEVYRKFGIPFDHVYAYEITPTAPAKVFRMVPDHLMAAYHWINVGVSADPNDGRLNPLNVILKNYNENDLIVIKLDIDTPDVELPLAEQLLQDARFGHNGLVDQFYFEHHVHLKELAPYWGRSGMRGSLKDSLELFSGLRKKGIAAHSWV